MTKKFKVVWIDDNPKRAATWIGGLDGTLRGTTVETGLEVIEFTANAFVEINECVEAWTTTPPDLIMLDHSFANVSGRMFGMNGSGLAHLLRIRLPDTPIVCLSGQKIDSENFNIEDLSEYTYLFEVEYIHLDVNLEKLFAIANDFPLICFPHGSNARQSIVDALKPPDIDRPALASVMPEEFEGTVVHGTSPHRIARWILNVFMGRPGFLYDALEVATFLGLSENSFLTKVSSKFEPALYQGPFATSTNPLWWASTLTDVLYSEMPESDLPPHEAGRQFAGIDEADYSQCGVTGKSKPAPDVVAYVDTTKVERKAVWHSFAVPLSEEANSTLGFQPRMKIRNDRKGE